MAAKKKVVAKKLQAKKPVKVKAPKKESFKAVQKRATALFADWYTRNEAQVVKYLERMEKVLAEMNEEPKEHWTPVPYPTVGDAVPAGSPVEMTGRAVSLVPPPKPELMSPEEAAPPGVEPQKAPETPFAF